ncbi:hypothetical protein LZ30DRAFT_728009 [Colletotrichum cereale]|nr:hypothetical protein LZ30DRAFT_728009 [Colletotrichum cereale]
MLAAAAASFSPIAPTRACPLSDSHTLMHRSHSLSPCLVSPYRAFPCRFSFRTIPLLIPASLLLLLLPNFAHATTKPAAARASIQSLVPSSLSPLLPISFRSSTRPGLQLHLPFLLSTRSHFRIVSSYKPQFPSYNPSILMTRIPSQSGHFQGV